MHFSFYLSLYRHISPIVDRVNKKYEKISTDEKQKSKSFTCVADILFEYLLAFGVVGQVPLHACTCFEYFDVL